MYSGVVGQPLKQALYCGEAVVVVVPDDGVDDGGLGLVVFSGIWLPVAEGNCTGPADCRLVLSTDLQSAELCKQSSAEEINILLIEECSNSFCLSSQNCI